MSTIDPFADTGPTPDQVRAWDLEARRRNRGRSKQLSVLEVIALNVRRARQRRGWSAQQLADRLSEVGRPISRPSISELETGKRGVYVEDLIALALALDTSPTDLLMPDEGQFVAVIPGRAKVYDWSRDEMRGWMGDATRNPDAVVRDVVRRAVEPILEATRTAAADLVDAFTMDWKDPNE